GKLLTCARIQTRSIPSRRT
ncbi:hypothetical protein CCACVL1_00749, partial [Corchorus capsularis]